MKTFGFLSSVFSVNTDLGKEMENLGDLGEGEELYINKLIH